MNGYKFRRQHAIDRFIVDYYCKEANLIIEVDGPIHKKQADADQERQEALTNMGFRFLRFTNEQVYCQMQMVIAQILKAIKDNQKTF